MADDLFGPVAVDIFVIVPREEGPAVDVPEILLYRGDAGRLVRLLLGHAGDDVEPGHDRPDPVLLADVVASRPETLLAADGHLVVVEESAEELPSRRNFVTFQALLLGYKIDRSTRGHTACKTVHALLLEVWDELCVMCDDRKAVPRRDEGVSPVDHITVPIAVASSTKVNFALVDRFHE